MASVKLIRTSDGIERALDGIVARGRDLSAYLNRVTFQQYLNAQLQRWQTENASETGLWKELNDKYAKEKIRIVTGLTKDRKRVTKHPRIKTLLTDTGSAAGGRAKMILTGRLADAAQGRGAALLKVVTNSGLKVSIDLSVLPYAQYASKVRPMMSFGTDTEALMVNQLVSYMMGGK